MKPEKLLECGHTVGQHESGLGRRDMCKGYSDLELEAQTADKSEEEEEV